MQLRHPHGLKLCIHRYTQSHEAMIGLIKVTNFLAALLVSLGQLTPELRAAPTVQNTSLASIKTFAKRFAPQTSPLAPLNYNAGIDGFGAPFNPTTGLLSGQPLNNYFSSFPPYAQIPGTQLLLFLEAMLDPHLSHKYKPVTIPQHMVGMDPCYYDIYMSSCPWSWGIW